MIVAAAVKFFAEVLAPNLRLLKRLGRDCGVEFCVIVEVFFDD